MEAVRLLALGALLSLVPAPDPGDCRKLLESLRLGDGEVAARELESAPVREVLKTDADALSQASFAGACSARVLARKAPAAARRVAASLLELTADSIAAQPGGFPELAGRFHALLADGRIRRVLGLPVTAEPFVKAGEGLELLYAEVPADGFYLLEAARAFADAADLAGEQGPALWDRAERMAGAIREKHPGSAPSVAGGFGLLLDRLRWGAARREKGLEARLDFAMEYLAAARKAAPEDRGLASAHNEAVSTARLLGIRRPGLEFELDRMSPCPGLLVSVPLGIRWTAAPEADPQVVQDDPDLGRVRSLAFSTFQWKETYDLPDGSRVAGGSMKDLAGKYFDGAVKGLKKVQARRPVAAGRLRQCPAGWIFEVSGTDEKGVFSRRREWYFKSAADRQQTYRVALVDFLPDAGDDPALDAVLESIRESPK